MPKACASEFFTSNGQGAALSKASFPGRRVPVLGRFSLSGASHMLLMPQPVRGLGLQFKPGGGEEWRTALAVPVFPAWHAALVLLLQRALPSATSS